MINTNDIINYWKQGEFAKVEFYIAKMTAYQITVLANEIGQDIMALINYLNEYGRSQN